MSVIVTPIIIAAIVAAAFVTAIIVITVVVVAVVSRIPIAAVILGIAAQFANGQDPVAIVVRPVQQTSGPRRAKGGCQFCTVQSAIGIGIDRAKAGALCQRL
ncbi:hypothetical protein [uncultured Tateyamaria sp.]|uniref:hypothetical protein n=1 Tax=Tateyamaria sp. 1078 TaxID=3417464 RepID=UPI00261A11C1|nr:hypothetical protein [uncultured Tateyamaria sp.]